MNTHTHTFNGPLSGTTQVSRYQKGKANLDFTEARDGEWQWHQLGHMQVCTSLQTDNHSSTLPLSFYRPDALPAAQPTASKHWTCRTWNKIKYNKCFLALIYLILVVGPSEIKLMRNKVNVFWHLFYFFYFTVLTLNVSCMFLQVSIFSRQSHCSQFPPTQHLNAWLLHHAFWGITRPTFHCITYCLPYFTPACIVYFVSFQMCG